MTIQSVMDLFRLEKTAGLDLGALQSIQEKKLERLLNHAYVNVPYYKRLFNQNGVSPRDIQTVADLAHLPVTDKAALRSMDIADITAGNRNRDRLVHVWTSGSTGMPTSIYFTRDDYREIDMAYMRSFRKSGLRFTDRRAFFLDPHSFDTKAKWYTKIGIGRSVNISCFDDPESQMEVLLRAKPDFIHGYPSSICEIAKVILEKKIKGIRPRVISTAAELLHRRDRELIKAAFGVEPFDRYAARECGCIAWECEEHRGYHVNIDCLVVEFLRDGRPVASGTAGDVVITNLHSYAMPFIRYRVGDIGVPTDRTCTCRSRFPLMDIIEGRDEDFIVLPDGKRISPMAITGTLDYVPGVKQFRVVQENMRSLTVLIAKAKDFGPQTVSGTETEMKRIVGKALELKIKVVDSIPREESGKVRAVISKVRPT